MALRHFQLRQKNRIVQRSGYLADTAAQAVHHLPVHVRARHEITVIGGKRGYCLIRGKLIPRIQCRTRYQVAPVCHIGAP